MVVTKSLRVLLLPLPFVFFYYLEQFFVLGESMSNTNVFVLDKSSYTRKIDTVNQYVEQASCFLELMTGKSKQICSEFVKNSLRNKESNPGVCDPAVEYLERQANGDREKKQTTLTRYITEALTADELIAPTLTTYLSTKVKESLLVAYVDENIAARSKAKKQAFAAKAAKQYDLAEVKNIEQTNKKLSNNAVSGAHVSASTPLFNKTAHSTLTSTCRTTSGYGNANNEKFLSGNRHYYSSDIVINNIVSIVSNIDYVKLAQVVEKYKLKELSVDECLDCVFFSSDTYWVSDTGKKAIRRVIEKLTPIQRQAFVYIGDMYHLMIHNSEMVHGLVGGLLQKVKGSCSDPLSIIKDAREDVINLAQQICSEEMMGKGKDHQSLLGTEQLDTLALTIENINSTLSTYGDLIGALWVTNNVPASVAYFPESVRRSALTSDTDSTIFTVQDWVQWYCGDIGFQQTHMSVAAVMIFLASQTITHVLAIMSANFGISNKRLHDIAMKNEYKFDVFVPTQVAKHYYATMSCQEGNVFDKLKGEIKGVHLKSSNAPAKITKQATVMMEEIIKTVMAGNKIKILDLLKEIGDLERNIIKFISEGKLEYFRLAQIKSAESYKSGAVSSPYKHHVFWNEIFAKKYGAISEPPYTCIKVSTVLDNATATANWVANMTDKTIAARVQAWMTKNNRVDLPTILLSVDIISNKGIPEELLSIIDTRTMVSDLSRIFYIILETLGYFIANDKKTKLIMDFH